MRLLLLAVALTLGTTGAARADEPSRASSYLTYSAIHAADFASTEIVLATAGVYAAVVAHNLSLSPPRTQ